MDVIDEGASAASLAQCHRCLLENIAAPIRMGIFVPMTFAAPKVEVDMHTELQRLARRSAVLADDTAQGGAA